MIDILRNIHIITGLVLLLLGALQIILPKYGLRHRNIGTAYFLTMFIVTISSMIIALYRIFIEENSGLWFLFDVSLFSLYMCSSGFLLARVKNRRSLQGINYLPIAGMLIGSGLMILAFNFLLKGEMSAAMIAFVFGSIQTMFSLFDFQYFVREKRSKKHGEQTWKALHIGRMIGSYIAAVTAYLVNAVTIGPIWVKWLGPTIIGTALIIYFTNKLLPHKHPIQ